MSGIEDSEGIIPAHPSAIADECRLTADLAPLAPEVFTVLGSVAGVFLLVTGAGRAVWCLRAGVIKN